MTDPIYLDYWKKKELVSKSLPHFPLVLWWPEPGLSPVEKIIYNSVQKAQMLLDVGAGNLRIRDKLRASGLQAVYKTLDIGSDFLYDYKSIEEVQENFNAILFLDVLEHLDLRHGLETLQKLVNRLSPEGVLVVQTPNARCIRSSAAKDMTHIHSYNLSDLYSHLITLGLNVQGYRVAFREQPSPSISWKFKYLLGAWITTRLLGADFADNILLVATKPSDLSVERRDKVKN